MKNICFDRVGKKYGETTVYDGFSLEIEAGKITCLLGPSGCGKTTLLNMLAGLVSYQGKIENIPNRISYIFQEERLLPNLTVRQNIRFVLGKGASDAAIDSVLEKVELLDKADAYPSELSGEQAQREEKRTAVFVTHDAEEAYMLAHRAVVLNGGAIAADIAAEGELPRPYGEASLFRQKILDALMR